MGTKVLDFCGYHEESMKMNVTSLIHSSTFETDLTLGQEILVRLWLEKNLVKFAIKRQNTCYF